MLAPRPYRDEADLAAMRQPLALGRRAARAPGGPCTYYAHPGDLDWWLHWLNQDDDRRATIELWEDADGLLAWGLLTPQAGAFDVFVHPDLAGTSLAAEIWAHTEARLESALRAAPASGGSSNRLWTMWVAEADRWLSALLLGRGFSLAPSFYWILERDLAQLVPATPVPAGFEVRAVAGEADVPARAAAARLAFGSRLPEARYVARYHRFRRTAAYTAALDLAAFAPGGQVGAFALVWPDAATGEALFEPVGTHPDFRRHGLARAVVAAGLQLAQQRGLARAVVAAEHDNGPALRLYQSLGFEIRQRVLTYHKER